MLAPSVWRGVSTRKSVALTFDDGPSDSTPELLEILDRHHAKATFFQCGCHVRRLPAVAREVAASGHEIGNHSDTHPAFHFRSGAFILEELTRAQRSIADVTNVQPRLFRAPYGVRWFGMRSAQRQLGLLGVMWTTIGRDWMDQAPAVEARLLRGAFPGAIFCLHDGRETQERPDISATLQAVRRVVPALLDQGYHFETVSEILCPQSPSPTPIPA